MSKDSRVTPIKDQENAIDTTKNSQINLNLKQYRQIRKIIESELLKSENGSAENIVNSMNQNIPELKLTDEQKSALNRSFNDTFTETKKNYRDTHVFGLNKTPGQMIQTSGAIVTRTLVSLLASVGRVTGVVLSSVGKMGSQGNANISTPLFMASEALGEIINDLSKTGIKHVVDKNAPIYKSMENAGLQKPGFGSKKRQEGQGR